MKIILSTRNPSKADQIKGVFHDDRFEIITLTEAGIEGEVIEDGNTLEENATKKAMFAYEKAKGEWVMADDTGIFINALEGAPGIKAARWAGENATTLDIMNFTLKNLEGSLDRSAYFETVAVLVSPEGEKYVFSGRADGILLEQPRIEPQPSMPYSPLFQPNGYDKTWAEMTIDEENAISHRGKAFIQVKDFLLNIK